MQYLTLYGTLKLGGVDESMQKEILEFVQNEGVEIGKYKNKIDLQSLINKIRIAREDVAWIGMEIKGTNLIIDVVKADKKPDIIDEKIWNKGILQYSSV